MNKITINGETINVEGNDIVITKNGKVSVSDKTIKTGLTGEVKVRFEGDLANIDCTNLVVNGNVQGDVDCTNLTVQGGIEGDVDANNVRCENIGGDVDANKVNCKNVSGNISI